MKVRMQVLENSDVVEDYTVPDASWIQTETLGAQNVPAVTEPIKYTFPRGRSILFSPISPPKIPLKLRKLLDSPDHMWGKNGFEWMGTNREHAGGTSLNRAREYCDKLRYRKDLPLSENEEIRKFCETELW